VVVAVKGFGAEIVGVKKRMSQAAGRPAGGRTSERDAMRLKLLTCMLASAALGATLSVTHAQQPPALRADIVSVTAGDYPAARAVVNIDAASGAGLKDVEGLTAANFTATVGGQTAPVLSADLASSQDAPLDVLFLMDVSGSMAGEPITQAKAAAKGLVRALAPNDRVAVISFADTVNLVQDYTVDRAQADAAIDRLNADGNTALYDATAAAAVKAGSSPNSRRAVILLSDGAQDGVTTKTTREQAIAAATGVGVPFFAIGEGQDIDRAYLTQLGTASKGRYMEAPQLTDMDGLFASIGRLLMGQFIVTFDASPASGTAEAPVAITLHMAAASATAQATFKPGPGFAPPGVKVTLTGIQEGEVLTAPRTITAVPDNTQNLTRVAFYVDGVDVYETANSPYTFAFDPSAYGANAHAIKAAVVVGTRTSESASVTFSSHPVAVVKGTGSGGGLPVLPIAAGAVALLSLIFVAAVLVRARRSGRDGNVDGPAADQRITPWAAPHRNVSAPAPDATDEAPVLAEEIGEPMGVLVSRAGPLLGSEYVVGGKPVSIGSGRGCGVRIDDIALSAEEARIWVRDGHLMVHKMTRLVAIASSGVSGGWVILEPGDVLEIGDHRFEFRLWTAPPPEDAASEIPNILRDPEIRRLPATPRPSAAPATGFAGPGRLAPYEAEADEEAS
jgi:Mg-chelatase subunit ChlD